MSSSVDGGVRPTAANCPTRRLLPGKEVALPVLPTAAQVPPGNARDSTVVTCQLPNDPSPPALGVAGDCMGRSTSTVGGAAGGVAGALALTTLLVLPRAGGSTATVGCSAGGVAGAIALTTLLVLPRASGAGSNLMAEVGASVAATAGESGRVMMCTGMGSVDTVGSAAGGVAGALALTTLLVLPRASGTVGSAAGGVAGAIALTTLLVLPRASGAGSNWMAEVCA